MSFVGQWEISTSFSESVTWVSRKPHKQGKAPYTPNSCCPFLLPGNSLAAPAHDNIPRDSPSTAFRRLCCPLAEIRAQSVPSVTSGRARGALQPPVRAPGARQHPPAFPGVLSPPLPAPSDFSPALAPPEGPGAAPGRCVCRGACVVSELGNAVYT